LFQFLRERWNSGKNLHHTVQQRKQRSSTSTIDQQLD
jgi:hypothetical protein